MVTPKQFVRLLRDLLKSPHREIDRLIVKGDAAIDDQQPFIAAMHYTEAYGILKRLNDPSSLPLQLAIVKKILHAQQLNHDSAEIHFWESILVELQQEILGKKKSTRH